jgi:exodeoxyribonuclease V beta subunit
LGPILYLFVRGMSALDPPAGVDPPCGVWSWQPPPALVESLSELFDRGVTP